MTDCQKARRPQGGIVAVERSGRLRFTHPLLAAAVQDSVPTALRLAVASLRASLTEHDRLQMPFARARTLLAYGQVLRRANARQAAGSALEEAFAVFCRLGATTWADRRPPNSGGCRSDARRPG